MRAIVLGAMVLVSSSPSWAMIGQVQTKAAEDTIQIQQRATATSLTYRNSVSQPMTIRDSGHSLSSSQSTGHPHPYIDATAYGCKGDGVTDDTACITSALAAVCAAQIGATQLRPELDFPPGIYMVSQPQLPSTAPIFEMPCNRVTIKGFGTAGTLQFVRGPMAVIRVMPGTSPNNAPVFDARYPTSSYGVTFRDIELDGYNKALWFYTSTGNKLENVNLYVQRTGQPDNQPLELTNLFWFEWHGGECATAEAPGVYCVLMTGDAPLGSEAPLVGLSEFDNLQGIGGTFHYDQRVNTSGGGPGNLVFRDIRGWEVNYTPFLYITNSTGHSGSAALPIVTNLTFDNVTTADTIGLPALIELNSAGTNLTGVIIDFSIGGNSGSPAIQNDHPGSSSIIGCNIRSGGNYSSANLIQDANGHPISGCSIQTWNGFDYFVQSGKGYDYRLRSDVNAFGESFGDALRATFNGSRFAGVAIDPVFGLMLNDGTDFGYGASIAENAPGSIDIQFAKTYPPTNVSGTPGTGGSIPARTYYATMYSTTTNCNSSESAPSSQSAGVTLGGRTNAINWSWTLPRSGVSNAATGYCIAISTAPNLNNGKWQPVQTDYSFISGASTTTYAMTALPNSGGLDSTISALAPAHRFTPNSLGINTTSPVPFTLTQNGGYVCSLATKSSAYTLTTRDCRIQVTGTTTITIPHTLPASGLTNIWHVFSVSGSTKLACDSGTINGSTTITIANNTGKDVYADNTNCFAQ